MPVPVQPPAQPPAQPPVSQPAPNQQQNQQQRQSQNPVNITNPSTNTKNNSNVKSEGSVIQSPSSSLSNYQINSSGLEQAYFGYSNKTTIPGTSIYGDLSYINDSFNSYGNQGIVAKVGFKHTFGGKAKKLAVKEIEVNTLARVLSVCDGLGYFKGEVEIDFESQPHLAPCDGVKPVKVAVATPPAPTTTEPSMMEMKKIILQQQKMIEQLSNRLPVEYGAPVRVGG